MTGASSRSGSVSVGSALLVGSMDSVTCVVSRGGEDKPRSKGMCMFTVDCTTV